MTSLLAFLVLSSAPIAAPDITQTLRDRFSGDPQLEAKASKILERIPVTNALKEQAWKTYLSVPDATLKAEFDSKTVSTSDRTSPYLWRYVGTKPKEGWGLVIAMHGGGNGPKSMNDGEWKYMFDHYYRDHPEAPGYVYLALRAPNDTWNGFYDDSICPLIERLVFQFVKFAEVDPNAVYACGASHGGYGAFVIGPKIPYRFAAVHPAASAGTDGETEGVNLRNVRFTWAVGEMDTAYGRHDRCVAFQKQWDEWKAKYGGFDGGLEEVKGAGHLIGKHELDKTAELRTYHRNPSPKKLIWVQTDNVLHRFYWLEATSPVDKGRVEATIEGNTITVHAEGQGKIGVWLSPELVDLSKPITINRDGTKTIIKPKASLEVYCRGLAQTKDPSLSGLVNVYF